MTDVTVLPDRPRVSTSPERARSSQLPRFSQVPRTPVLERKILLGLLLVLALGAGIVLSPFWPWFVLALWTANLMRPMVDRLTVATKGRAGASGLAIVALLIAAMIPVGLCVMIVAVDAQRLVRTIFASSSGRAALMELVATTGKGNEAPLTDLTALDVEAVAVLFREHGSLAVNAFSELAGALTGVLLGVFVYFAATYAALVHGREAYGWLEAQVPISTSRLERFRDAFQETGRGLLFSVLLTGLVQAVVATVAYVALGVPRAAALGFATFLASLVPSVGSALVWGPVGIGLLIAGLTTKGVVLIVIGVVVISSVDNVLRPLFARWGSLTLDPFLVLFSMLGGVLVFGGFGLILGPLVVRLALEAARMVKELSRMDPLSQTSAPNASPVSAGDPAIVRASPRSSRSSWVNFER